jgi:hypothetical protein
MSFLLGIDPGLRQIREQTVDVFTAGVGFTAGSSTTVSLTADPGTENAVIISFDGIVQHHDTFSQSGSTITFDAAIPTGVAKVEAVYVASVLSYQRVQDAGVTTAKLGGDAVTSAKIADDQIDSEHYVNGSIDDDHLATGVGPQGKQTIWVPAGAMRPTTSNGCAALTDVETTAGRPDMTVLDFDATSDEHAQFQVMFPKQWNLGTVTFQAAWTTTATDTDGVSWGLQGVACGDGDTIDVAYGTGVVVDDAGQSTAEDFYLTAESGAVTIAGTPADDQICYFRVYRDVSDDNDTATEDARLIGIKIIFTIDAGNDD